MMVAELSSRLTGAPESLPLGQEVWRTKSKNA